MGSQGWGLWGGRSLGCRVTGSVESCRPWDIGSVRCGIAGSGHSGSHVRSLLCGH